MNQQVGGMMQEGGGKMPASLVCYGGSIRGRERARRGEEDVLEVEEVY